MWAGLVSYTDDHQPVFGAFANPGNLFVANTFHSAVAISPAIRRMIADYWKTARSRRSKALYAGALARKNQQTRLTAGLTFLDWE
jgi:glycine/D-amino acid oxidase-like deaminating enzyme